MNKSFDIIRINKQDGTITVLLKLDDKTLQQDVVVENFTDMDVITAEINRHLDKFEADITAATKAEEVPVSPDLQALVDKYTKSFQDESN
jgi:hypothetical protein